MKNVMSINKLCSGCGMCQSVCPVDAITTNSENGFIRPVVNDNCIDCGKCVSLCPNYDGNRGKGTYKDFYKILWGHSLDDETRMEAASGGVVTELCCYLLNSMKVDYVVTADEYRNDRKGSFYVCRKEEDLRSRKGSKYCPIDMGKAIKYIKQNAGKCAIICLPCLARGIRKYMSIDKKLEEKVKYIIVLLCNHVPSYKASEFMLSKIKCRHADMIKYRGAGWHYIFRAYKNSHEKYNEIGRSEDYWGGSFSRFFWQNGCIACQDHFGIYGDICVGDADFVKDREPGIENKGETVCFIQNAALLNVLEEMKKLRLISLHDDIQCGELEKYFGKSCDYNHVSHSNLNDNELLAFLCDLKRDIPVVFLGFLRHHMPSGYVWLRNIYRCIRK